MSNKLKETKCLFKKKGHSVFSSNVQENRWPREKRRMHTGYTLKFGGNLPKSEKIYLHKMDEQRQTHRQFEKHNKTKPKKAPSTHTRSDITKQIATIMKCNYAKKKCEAHFDIVQGDDSFPDLCRCRLNALQMTTMATSEGNAFTLNTVVENLSHSSCYVLYLLSKPVQCTKFVVAFTGFYLLLHWLRKRKTPKRKSHTSIFSMCYLSWSQSTINPHQNDHISTSQQVAESPK